MEDESRTRLPLHHPDRIRARDLKLQQRDEVRANMNNLSRYRCPCNLCGGRRRPYKTSTVARHLRHRGRHGALRGWTQVMFFLYHTLEVGLPKCLYTFFDLQVILYTNMYQFIMLAFRGMTTTPQTRNGTTTLGDTLKHFLALMSQLLR